MSSAEKPEQHDTPVPTPDQKPATVRTGAAREDKVAWIQAAKLKGLPLEDWAIKELNAAAEEEKRSGSETK